MVVSDKSNRTGDGCDYNILWKKAARTAYVCMRECFFDCPNRERVGFWGDGTPKLNHGWNPPAIILSQMTLCSKRNHGPRQPLCLTAYSSSTAHPSMSLRRMRSIVIIGMAGAI